MTLSVCNLSARYPAGKGEIHALDDISFTLESGRSMGIAGESACGKSTLGFAIMRMLQGGRITGGSVKLDGEPLLEMDEAEFDKKYRWKRISMVFQGAMNSLDPVFTVRDQFDEILAQHGFEGDRDAAIRDAIASVSLDGTVLSKYPHELSGGMKQRLVIAMALLLKPDLVIADEPTTALDVLVQAQIINLLKELKKQGTSIIMITHDLAILSEIADVIGIMYGGQLAEFGSARQIYQSPRHPYTQALLRSIPTLRGERPSYIRGSPPSLLLKAESCRFADRCPQVFEKCGRDPPDIVTGDGHARCWLYE